MSLNCEYSILKFNSSDNVLFPEKRNVTVETTDLKCSSIRSPNSLDFKTEPFWDQLNARSSKSSQAADKNEAMSSNMNTESNSLPSRNQTPNLRDILDQLLKDKTNSILVSGPLGESIFTDKHKKNTTSSYPGDSNINQRKQNLEEISEKRQLRTFRLEKYFSMLPRTGNHKNVKKSTATVCNRTTPLGRLRRREQLRSRSTSKKIDESIEINIQSKMQSRQLGRPHFSWKKHKNITYY